MTRRARSSNPAALIIGLMCLGCQRTPSETASKPAAEQTTAPTVKAPPSPPSQAMPSHGANMGRPAGSADALAITWKDPDGWQRVAPSSPMRAAQYTVPPVAGDAESAELTVFYFGAQMGGGVEDNISRWTGQFKGMAPEAVKRSQKESNGLVHSFVQIEAGQFQGASMMGTPSETKENYGLLGVVTETPTGKYFFKMTGPSKTVAANEAKFLGLVESIRAK